MMETITKMAAELEEMKAERKRNAEAASGPPPRPKHTKYLCGGKGADDFTVVRWSDGSVIRHLDDQLRHKILREIEEGVGLIVCMCIFVCC
jgi:hypothetical protein